MNVVERNAQNIIDELKDWLMEENYDVSQSQVEEEAQDRAVWTEYDYRECYEYVQDTPGFMSMEIDPEGVGHTDFSGAISGLIDRDVREKVNEWVGESWDSINDVGLYINALGDYIDEVGLEDFGAGDIDAIAEEDMGYPLDSEAQEMANEWYDKQFENWSKVF